MMPCCMGGGREIKQRADVLCNFCLQNALCLDVVEYWETYSCACIGVKYGRDAGLSYVCRLYVRNMHRFF